MAIKALIIAAFIASVSAGGPASYAISSPSIDHYSVGHSNEHTVKGLYGQNVLSSYSKSVATPHSQAHVSLSKATNDVYPGYGYAHGYAAPLAHGYAHAPAAVIAKPAVAAYGGYYGHGYAAPLAHGYAAPLAHGYAHAPAVIAKPAYGGYYGHGYATPYAHGYAAPLAHGYAAPYAHGVIAKPAIAAAPVLGSTVSFHGLGAHYGW